LNLTSPKGTTPLFGIDEPFAGIEPFATLRLQDLTIVVSSSSSVPLQAAIQDS
jgi:ABC-type lipopolysaccharide export system ATPase subunit